MSFNIAILASGRGSNMEALARAIDDGRLEARICLVAGNRPEAPVFDLARERGIPIWSAFHQKYPDRESFDFFMLEAVRSSGADAVILAGYMRLLSPSFIRNFAGPILNIHPSLLPAFPGVRAVEEALQRGVRLTGSTVHYVDEGMDAGPIIVQGAVPVWPDDTAATLASRIRDLEHVIYPEAVQWLVRGWIPLQHGKVMVRPEALSHSTFEEYGIVAWPPVVGRDSERKET